MKVKVTIEETLSRTIEIDVPTEDADEAMEIAEEQAIEDYRNEKIVLDAEDFTGMQIMVEAERGESTGWGEI